MNKNIFRLTAVILSAALAIACLGTATQIPAIPTETAAPADTAAPPPAETSAPAEPAATPEPTAAQPPALAGGGWLLINTEDGLWAVRPDGSESSVRIPGRVIVPGPLSGAVSSADGLFAYLTTSDPSAGYGNFPGLTLNIVSLLGRGTAATIPLTSPETEPGDEFPNDIQRAMTEQPSFAWSPEGMRLAFIGAQQGPSADLYEYYRESGEVVQLTDGPAQAYRPQWSPDGVWIVHAAADGFGTGAGIAVSGVYAARADDSGVISLYDVPQHSGDEQLVGWLDTSTAVMRSWYATCGPSDLRLVDLNAQQADLVFDGCLSAAAAGDGGVLFAQSTETAMFDDDPRPGLFLLTAFNRTPQLMTNDDVREAAWIPDSGVFLARTQDARLLTVSLAGEIRTLPVDGSILPVVAPGGLWWGYAYASRGIFAGGTGTEPQQIFEGEIAPGQMLFSPDGNALYFLTASGNLYAAQAPDWAPVLLVSGIKPASTWWSSMAWVEE